MGRRALAEDLVVGTENLRRSLRLLPRSSAISGSRDQAFCMGGLPLENDSSALALSGSQQKQVPNKLNSNGTESKPQKKICCACPDTKKLRDECIVQHGEDACAKWIEAHRQCLRAEGFNV